MANATSWLGNRSGGCSHIKWSTSPGETRNRGELAAGNVGANCGGSLLRGAAIRRLESKAKLVTQEYLGDYCTLSVGPTTFDPAGMSRDDYLL